MDLINSDLLDLGQYLPSEFCRQLTSLEGMGFWKASEFRCFLLYTEPIVSKGHLTKKLRSRFIILHCVKRYYLCLIIHIILFLIVLKMIWLVILQKYIQYYIEMIP